MKIKNNTAQGYIVFTTTKLIGKRVVLIEDEEGIREPLTKFFHDILGAEVSSCADGNTGLNLVVTNQPHLVLTDGELLEGSGLEVVRQLQQSDDFKGKIIGMSGRPEIVKAFQSLGIPGLQKSFRLERLNEIIDELFAD